MRSRAAAENGSSSSEGGREGGGGGGGGGGGDGRRLARLRRGRGSDSIPSGTSKGGRGHADRSSANANDAGAGAHASFGPMRIEGTSARPPKAAAAFMYPIARRDADRRECCRVAPVVSQCEADERREAIKYYKS